MFCRCQPAFWMIIIDSVARQDCRLHDQKTYALMVDSEVLPTARGCTIASVYFVQSADGLFLMQLAAQNKVAELGKRVWFPEEEGCFEFVPELYA